MNSCQGTQISKTEKFWKSFSLLSSRTFKGYLIFRQVFHWSQVYFAKSPKIISLFTILQLNRERSWLSSEILSFIWCIWTFFAQNDAGISFPKCIWSYFYACKALHRSCWTSYLSKRIQFSKSGKVARRARSRKQKHWC